MTRRTVYRSAVLLAGVATLFGAVSLYAELQSRAASSGQRRATAATPRPSSGQAPLTVEFELLPRGTELILFPDVPDVVERRGRELGESNGTYQLEDGRLYDWHTGRPQRVWLFAVVAETKPRVTVER